MPLVRPSTSLRFNRQSDTRCGLRTIAWFGDWVNYWEHSRNTNILRQGDYHLVVPDGVGGWASTGATNNFSFDMSAMALQVLIQSTPFPYSAGVTFSLWYRYFDPTSESSFYPLVVRSATHYFSLRYASGGGVGWSTRKFTTTKVMNSFKTATAGELGHVVGTLRPTDWLGDIWVNGRLENGDPGSDTTALSGSIAYVESGVDWEQALSQTSALLHIIDARVFSGVANQAVVDYLYAPATRWDHYAVPTRVRGKAGAAPAGTARFETFILG